MHTPPLPLTRDLVLVGGGHAHALVLRRWAMAPLPGARVTLINPGPTAAYSGMLPGFVAGHYPRAALEIDLVRLAQAAGARLILGPVEGIDLAARKLHVPGRGPVEFDIASINVGVSSAMPELPGFGEHGVPAKPLEALAERWDRFRAGRGPARVAVIGGGVAGAELILAMAHALETAGRPARCTLLERDRALAALPPRAAARLRAALAAHGVEVIEGAAVLRVGEAAIDLADGRRIASDFTVGAAGARPLPWIAESGLALQDGFIRVDAHLQSSDPAVYAAGDCAHLSHAPRPKAGVFAVRAAPVLFDNLCAALSGTRPRRFRPQRDYLKLISLGRKSALGDRSGLVFSGPAIWRWKDWIDRRFMDRFADLPGMDGDPALPPLHAQGLEEALGGKPLCGGCGAKLGRGALRAALQAAPPVRRSDIAALPGDDAALIRMGETRQVFTTDHLRGFIADPGLMARIAAVHALGDIWAMGAAPQAATASLILPRMSAELQRRTLAEIMQEAGAVIRDAGAEIVGGHSAMGSELTIGFAITGLLDRDPITLAGARPGDALILTAPLGSGVIMAAAMAGRARGAWVAEALAEMARPQGAAAAILHAAHAMTDVTGFGLAGHLANLCEASGVGAEIRPEAVPLMTGAETLAQDGIRSSIWAENRMLAPDLPQGGRADLLFDPQTAGGLLAAVPPEAAPGLLARLQETGAAPRAAVIGRITPGPARLRLAPRAAG